MPAATWRKWYPHDIEKWNSSPAIQLLSDAAYRAYHSLIMCQWESAEGYLPENERLLQTLARVRTESEWSLVRVEILPLFLHENGHVFSAKQRTEWLRAKAVSNRKGRTFPDSDQTPSRVRPVSGHNNNNKDMLNTPPTPRGARRSAKAVIGIAKTPENHPFEPDADGYCKRCAFAKDHQSHQEAA
jgi:hypothetical protein